MDVVWIAAIAVFWVVMCEAVVGLHKLESPKRERP
jgi:hypothetical protein